MAAETDWPLDVIAIDFRSGSLPAAVGVAISS